MGKSMQYGRHDFRPGLPPCPRCGRPGTVLGTVGVVTILVCKNHRSKGVQAPHRYYAERETDSSPVINDKGVAVAARRGTGFRYEPELVAGVLDMVDRGRTPVAVGRRFGLDPDTVRHMVRQRQRNLSKKAVGA